MAYRDLELKCATKRKDYEAHREKRKLAMRAYRAKNRDELERKRRERHRLYGRKRGPRTAAEREKALAYLKRMRVERTASRLVADAKARARQRGLFFDLTQEWAEARWNGTCEITGFPFVVDGCKSSAFSPSLDRIDPAKGYAQDNCRFILWAINRFKNSDTDGLMFSIASAMVASREKKDCSDFDKGSSHAAAV